MPPDADSVETMLRAATPRRVSPDFADRIATAMRGAPPPPEARRRKASSLRFWIPVAAAAAAAILVSIVAVSRAVRPVRTGGTGSTLLRPLVSQVTIQSREDLGHFVCAKGTPVEAFRYRFTEKGIWRSSDGKKSIEAAIPFEAIVWVESQAY